LYGTYFVADSFYVDASLSYGDSGYDSSRHIVYTDIGGTVDRTAKGDTNGTQSAAGIATGYDFNKGPWTFGPHIGTYYIKVDSDSYGEHGAGGLNLTVGDQNAESFTLNGGAHLSRVFTPSWGVLIPHLRVDYVHEFKDGRETVDVGFLADPFSSDPLDPTPPIELRTDQPDPDYVVWSAGVSAQFINGMSGFVNYQGTVGYSDLTLSEFTFGLRWERTF
jgi:outer membrane autotransporter protein